MKSLSLAVFLSAAGFLFAQESVDISGFSPLQSSATARTGVSESFDVTPVKNLWLKDGFSIDPRGGESGTGALFYNKTDAGSYLISSLGLKLNLSPECKYRATVKYKAEDIRNMKNGSRLFCIEFTNKGKFAGGRYFYAPVEENKWSEIVLEFQPPAEFDSACAAFFLGKGATGKVWWDNLHIEPIGVLPAILYDIRPSNLTIRDERGEITVKAYLYLQGIPDSDLALNVKANGKSYLWRCKDHTFSGELGKLPDGAFKIDTQLLYLKNKTILAEKSFNLFVKKKHASKGTCIDKHGRTLVDGKAFLPIGFYSSVVDDAMLKNLKDAGFNCVMPYRACWNIDESFALAQKHGIKIFMNVMYQRPKKMAQGYPVMEFEGAKGIEQVLQAWVRKVKDHPALLGYYLSDENPLEEIPYMRKVRETVNNIDPDHFTVTLTYVNHHFPFFAETGDVLAVDQYPVETAASKTMSGIPALVSAAKATGIAAWWVPQAFHWGTYRAKELNEYKKFRFPTETEMRSMFLAGAVNGAKGFLLYNYSDIFGKGEKMEPGSAAKNWAKVVAATRVLKELESFILSTEKAPAVTLDSVRNAQLKAWSANGKVAVGIIGIGPGDSVAEFTIPGFPKLKSRYGSTVNLDGGKYRFSGKDISSDVLFSE